MYVFSYKLQFNLSFCYISTFVLICAQAFYIYIKSQREEIDFAIDVTKKRTLCTRESIPLLLYLYGFVFMMIK